MDKTKAEIIEKIKSANTVLVTVSKDPSIDQLAACIGLALLLGKLKKHGSAVFSGQIPSTLEFLKPEQTLEKTTDSLRDFIIALDKSKADKLRYKIEDQMVKIFITPYKSSLSEQDLEFSQGDFNVNLIVTLGVEKNEDLDQAIMSSGNILHDAPIVCINTNTPSTLGSISWNVPEASSLCELVAELAQGLGNQILDQQIATALLTGIVAETDRFSNSKTTSVTMSISSTLMAAGANQQLVATELEENQSEPQTSGDSTVTDDGELSIVHKDSEAETEASTDDLMLPEPPKEEEDKPISIPTPMPDSSHKVVTEPPSLGGTLTSNAQPQGTEPSTDPLSIGSSTSATLADQQKGNAPSGGFTPPPPSWVPPLQDKNIQNKVNKNLSDPNSTITKLEESVGSKHLAPNTNNKKTEVKSKPSKVAEAPKDSTYDPAFKFPNELDPKDLQPPSDSQAPPYPPPIITP